MPLKSHLVFYCDCKMNKINMLWRYQTLYFKPYLKLQRKTRLE
jgi:hypothetical protein